MSYHKGCLLYKKCSLIVLSTILLILVDQSSKIFLITYLKTQYGYTKNILPFFDLVYAWNYGISFGLFSEYNQHSNMLFLALNTCIIFYLLYLLCTNNDLLTTAAIIFVTGGAIGNLLDRILQGAVFDFISLHYAGYYFPAFNLADSFINIGALIFLYSHFYSKTPVNQSDLQ